MENNRIIMSTRTTGIDPETGLPYEPAKDPLSLEGELTPEEEAELERELGFDLDTKQTKARKLIANLEKYDFEDALGHPLGNCIHYIELCRLACEVPQ